MNRKTEHDCTCHIENVLVCRRMFIQSSANFRSPSCTR